METKSKYSACTSILIGKKASIDGTIMIGRNEDAKSSWPKHFIVRQHNEIINHFKSNDNDFEMDLPTTSAKYTATPEWTDKFGVFEEAGINEFSVAMSATESAYSNVRVLAADPLVPTGITEEAMVTVVLPFIHSAREGVKRLGEIIETHGTNESNGILFADDNEAWYMETTGGHYWVAQRIPDDSCAVIANQLSIQEIDFNDSDQFMFHTNIKDFVTNNNLNPDPSHFNFRKIFGTNDASDAVYNTPRVWYGHRLFSPSNVDNEFPESSELPFIIKPSHLLSVEDAQTYLSSHFQGTPYDPIGTGSETEKHKYRPISLAKTQESHILQMNRTPANLHWLSLGVSAQSVYIPFYAGITDTPISYKRGEQQYNSDSEYWNYKLAGVLVDAHLQQFSKPLADLQTDINVKVREMLKNADLGLPTKINEQEAYFTEKSAEIAQYSSSRYQEFINQVITESTDLSLLNFKTDANL